eukprot:m.123575 g.123575  ORF g.123575 m.123575 type:complete len:381 (-) comp9412_c2_seq1:194-1336(-)
MSDEEDDRSNGFGEDSEEDENFQFAFDQLQHSYDVLMEERTVMENFYQDLENNSAQQEEDLNSMQRTISEQARIISHLSHTVQLLRSDVKDFAKKPDTILYNLKSQLDLSPSIGADRLAAIVEEGAERRLSAAEVHAAVDADVEELKRALKLVHGRLQAKENLLLATQSQLSSYKEEVLELRVLVSESQSLENVEHKETDVGEYQVESPRVNMELYGRVEELSNAFGKMIAERDELVAEKERLEEMLQDLRSNLDDAQKRIEELQEGEEGNLGDELMEEEAKSKSLSLKEQNQLILKKDSLVIDCEILKDSLRDTKAMNATACHTLERLYMFTVSREKAISQMLSKPISNKQRKKILSQLESTSAEKEFKVDEFVSSYKW